eukprot:comp18614_c0_seq1/m.33602 comp18614_c0_seq1/g.33602  ORF comp18614_c0_seq1/g.33602 comp18614_c0_seq1/m.33602 type:complete len:316 (-) comp18614_c0_seq1:3-950(-)
MSEVLRFHLPSYIWSVSFSVDGQHVCIACGNGEVFVFPTNMTNVEPEVVLPGFAQSVRYTARFARAGGSLIAVAGDAGNCAAVFSRDGERQVVLRGHNRHVHLIDFNSDDSRLITASEDNTAAVWDAPTGRRIAVLTGHGADVISAAFSQNGAKAVTGSFGKLVVWNADTGQILAQIINQNDIRVPAHASFVSSVCFSPDDSLILSGSWDRALKLWRVENSQCVRVLVSHAAGVYDACFIDAATVVSAGSDGKVIITSVDRGKLAELPVESFATAVAVSGDASHVIAGCGDRSIVVWNIKQIMRSAQSSRAAPPR